MENWEEAIDLLSATRAFDHSGGGVTIDSRIIIEVAKLLTDNQDKDTAIKELVEALENLRSRIANDADAHAWFLDEQEAAIKAIAKYKEK